MYKLYAAVQVALIIIKLNVTFADIDSNSVDSPVPKVTKCDDDGEERCLYTSICK